MAERKLKKTKSRKDRGNNNTDSAHLASQGTDDTEPTIDALKRKAEKIRTAQLKLTLKKLRSLSNEEKENLEAMTEELVRQLLSDPIKRIENGVENGKNYARIVRQLFHLESE
jgi:glutamyl-tRNA reductase